MLQRKNKVKTNQGRKKLEQDKVRGTPNGGVKKTQKKNQKEHDEKMYSLLKARVKKRGKVGRANQGGLVECGAK